MVEFEFWRDLNMKRCFSKMIILGVIAAWHLSAATIASDTNTVGTTALLGNYWGETFQASVSANQLTFNFFSDATTHEATGDLYLFNSAPPVDGDGNVTLTPDGLSSAVGLIASASAFGNLWTFAPTVSVSAGAEYWVYVDAVQPTIYGGGSAVANQGPYQTDSATDAYFADNGVDINFLFSGVRRDDDGGGGDDTPEPATLLLMAPALLLVLRRRLTR
jgi:hypothetical protein